MQQSRSTAPSAPRSPSERAAPHLMRANTPATSRPSPQRRQQQRMPKSSRLRGTERVGPCSAHPRTTTGEGNVHASRNPGPTTGLAPRSFAVHGPDLGRGTSAFVACYSMHSTFSSPNVGYTSHHRYCTPQKQRARDLRQPNCTTGPAFASGCLGPRSHPRARDYRRRVTRRNTANRYARNVTQQRLGDTPPSGNNWAGWIEVPPGRVSGAPPPFVADVENVHSRPRG